MRPHVVAGVIASIAAASCSRQPANRDECFFAALRKSSAEAIVETRNLCEELFPLPDEYPLRGILPEVMYWRVERGGKFACSRFELKQRPDGAVTGGNDPCIGLGGDSLLSFSRDSDGKIVASCEGAIGSALGDFVTVISRQDSGVWKAKSAKGVEVLTLFETADACLSSSGEPTK